MRWFLEELAFCSGGVVRRREGQNVVLAFLQRGNEVIALLVNGSLSLDIGEFLWSAATGHFGNR